MRAKYLLAIPALLLGVSLYYKAHKPVDKMEQNFQIEKSIQRK
jgi:hypothetical protein